MAEAGVPVLPGVTVDARAVDLATAAERDRLAGPGQGGLRRRRAGACGSPVRCPSWTRRWHRRRREAAAAFGDGTVFLERFVESPRHIEVQIFADTQGQVIQLFERECSIQRRHQKIIEESPSPALERCRAGRAGRRPRSPRPRRSATSGPAPSSSSSRPDGDFFFLEVNTRLQVEHPVTEAVTGLDLVRLQLTVAEGEPLPAEAHRRRHPRPRHRSPPVRRGRRPRASSRRAAPFDACSSRPARGVRVDAGYADGSVVTTFYDAMLAKVIAWAPTRREAAALLAATLAGARIHGVTTNRDLLVGILARPRVPGRRSPTPASSRRHDPVALSAARLGATG